MARRKRNSSTLERANRRLESLLSIDPVLDFGNGLSVLAYDTAIVDLETKLAAYNTALSTIDSLADAVDLAEQSVLTLSENLLLSVGGRYGRTSKEYEMAGGSRRDSRRRSTASSSSPDSQPDSSTNDGSDTP